MKDTAVEWLLEEINNIYESKILTQQEMDTKVLEAEAKYFKKLQKEVEELWKNRQQ